LGGQEGIANAGRGGQEVGENLKKARLALSPHESRRFAIEWRTGRSGHANPDFDRTGERKRLSVPRWGAVRAERRRRNPRGGCVSTRSSAPRAAQRRR